MKLLIAGLYCLKTAGVDPYLCRSMKLSLRIILLALLPFVTTANGQAQPNSDRMSPEAYIAAFKSAAIADMVKTHVPASITMAQGMYESDYGNSPLAINAKNHFGIKCHKEWNGPTYHQDDDAADECFRKYSEVQESYDDHSDFLRSRERYASLFKLDITNYRGWAHGLKKAGYATNPTYAEKLIDLIERFNLSDLDRQGLAILNGDAPDKNAPDVKPMAGVKKEEKEEPEVKTASRPHTVSAPSPAVSANTINKVPFVRARKGDTWLKVSRENKLELWEVLEFNDAQATDILHEDEVVYIRPKKNKAEVEKHVVQPGETMRIIAQRYGIKKDRLYRMNKLDFDVEPKPGEVLILNKPLFLGMSL